MPPPPPPPPHFEKVNVNPMVPPTETVEKPSTKVPILPVSVKSFIIAVLQQYTNSFSQENLIGAGMLGTFYKAELPNGKLYAVKKLDKRSWWVTVLSMVRGSSFTNIAIVVRSALHSDEDFKKQVSWKTRTRMALGATRALEYLHEICEPPIHRDFKSANLLLNEELSVQVSNCNLTPLITSGSVSQLSGHLLTANGYGASEFESGIHTSKSDVFSFGVVMLELLTGRKSYDRSRNRGEHFLVRWAIPQLYDIDALSRMVDPSLNGSVPNKALSCFADIFSRCVETEPEFRPAMKLFRTS